MPGGLMYAPGVPYGATGSKQPLCPAVSYWQMFPSLTVHGSVAAAEAVVHDVRERADELNPADLRRS